MAVQHLGTVRRERKRSAVVRSAFVQFKPVAGRVHVVDFGSLTGVEFGVRRRRPYPPSWRASGQREIHHFRNWTSLSRAREERR